MKIRINGGKKLKGEISLQGSKNILARTIFIPLLAKGEFIFTNAPRISNTENAINLLKALDASADWIGANSIHVSTESLSSSSNIDSETLFHTSSGILVIPIMASKFGEFTIEKHQKRDDIGGDEIGSRQLSGYNDMFSDIGFEIISNERSIKYKCASTKPFVFDSQGSYGKSVALIFSALFREGVSTIKTISPVMEFHSFLELLINIGCKIKVDKNRNQIEVEGGINFNGFTTDNLGDRHELVTLVTAALVTESQIKIKSVNMDSLSMDLFTKYLNVIGVKYQFDSANYEFTVFKNQISDLKPFDLIGYVEPSFMSEWHVIMAPLFAMMHGTTTIVELAYSDRMRHWDELGKLGANFEYLQNKTDINATPIATRTYGNAKFKGTEVNGMNVRAAGALLIAGLAAKGSTIINDGEHLFRAYENLDQRLNALGADIRVIN